MAKTYNQLCADIAFDKNNGVLGDDVIVIMGHVAYELKNDISWRRRIEGASGPVDVNTIFANACALVDLSLVTLGEMHNLGIIRSTATGTTIVRVDEWIESRKKNYTPPAIQPHVLLSAATPELYKRENEDVYKSLYVAKRIQDMILKSYPNNSVVKAAKAKAWSDEIDAMIRLDGRTYAQVWDVFRYAHIHSVPRDSFHWKKVILSPANLRKHFDKILIEMNDFNSSKEKKQEVFKTKPMADEER